MYARWIVMPKNSNSGSDLATYIASNAELLTEQNYTDIDALVFAEMDIYQLVDDMTQALSDDGKISGGEWLALGADVIFLGLDVVAAGDIIKAVKVAKVANTEAKAANNVMDEYVSTPENAGMPNAVKRESRDNLILSY
jgi:hypothetical protein